MCRQEGIQVGLLDHYSAALALAAEAEMRQQALSAPFVNQAVTDSELSSYLFRG
jgi:hypothetical protein